MYHGKYVPLEPLQEKVAFFPVPRQLKSRLVYFSDLTIARYVNQSINRFIPPMVEKGNLYTLLLL